MILVSMNEQLDGFSESRCNSCTAGSSFGADPWISEPASGLAVCVRQNIRKQPPWNLSDIVAVAGENVISIPPSTRDPPASSDDAELYQAGASQHAMLHNVTVSCQPNAISYDN